jgi:alkylation response protein AidB-like acyl-CoA dehydrogenase
MNFALSPEQEAFRARFEAFCQGRIAPRAREVDREGRVPAESWQAIVESGYLRLFHAPSFGGLGADGITLGLAMEHLARACGSTFWVATTSTVLCGKILTALGTPAHHERWLGAILRGDAIGCFAVNEDSSGSELGQPQTLLRRSGPGYVLDGEKSRVANVQLADVAVVRAYAPEPVGARTTPDEVYVVVDLRQPGVTQRPFEKLGLHGMPWGAIGFDHVAVAEGDILGATDRQSILRAIEWGQLFQSFCSVGFAEAALEASIQFAAGRIAFGRSLLHLPIVHHRIADMRTEIDAARLLAQHAAFIKGQGESAGATVMMAKIFATEMAVRVADAAMRIHGGWGYATEFAVERLYRDSLANIPAGAASDRLREFVACALVGEDPWTYEPFDGLAASFPPREH